MRLFSEPKEPDEAANDAVLVQAAQRGDREAFSVLVSRHDASIFNVTTRMLGPTADAEDAAQETFVSAYRALSNFQFGSKLSTWLYRIAVNKCTDALRARRPTESLDDSDDSGQLVSEPADEETPHWELEQSELANELDRAVAELPAIYRESFVLRHVEGLGYDEMSTIVGVNRDALKMRVYKARNLLCRSLAHLNGVCV